MLISAIHPHVVLGNTEGTLLGWESLFENIGGICFVSEYCSNHLCFVVSPIKFNLGFYIYLMVAYIEYIWLKRNYSESNLCLQTSFEPAKIFGTHLVGREFDFKAYIAQ